MTVRLSNEELNEVDRAYEDRDAARARARWLQKENERLRAALQKIADDDVDADLKRRPDILSGIAFAALAIAGTR